MPAGSDKIVVTAGSNYLDIDAYACCVAMKELLILQGKNAIACSNAAINYSVCPYLLEEGQMQAMIRAEKAQYIIMDVSDPAYFKDVVPLSCVTEIYDHHVGFESYWTQRIGNRAHIEFIGAAATLVYREWKKAGLQDRMTRSTAQLLIAAILDNTLNLISTNTTEEDRETYEALCLHAGVDETFCATYFSEVQKSVENDLENALRHDLKNIGENAVLPANMAQLCVWNAENVLERLADIRAWFSHMEGGFMLNLIDIRRRCSYFVCDEPDRQKEIKKVFGVDFEAGVARTTTPYLRKQILKAIRKCEP